jgi:hypothetical protein
MRFRQLCREPDFSAASNTSDNQRRLTHGEISQAGGDNPDCVDLHPQRLTCLRVIFTLQLGRKYRKEILWRAGAREWRNWQTH